MSQKQVKGKLSGALSALSSLIIIAVGMALLVVLFRGGTGGAQEIIGSWLAWIAERFTELQDRVIGTAAGGVA